MELRVSNSNGVATVTVYDTDEGQVVREVQIPEGKQVVINEDSEDFTVEDNNTDTPAGLPYEPAEEPPKRPLEEIAGPREGDAPEDAEAVEETETETTDAAQEKADELGIDINAVDGTGQDGRVLVSDVEDYAKENEVTP